LPAGFQAQGPPGFAVNPATGQVAHLDGLSNTWSTYSPPPGFNLIPATDGAASYVNPATGQHISFAGAHFGGEPMWVSNDVPGQSVTHTYDPSTGTSAYLEPKSGAWISHDPPPGFTVDTDRPPEQLGFHYLDPSGRPAHYNVFEHTWYYDDTGLAVPPATVERPGTIGDATWAGSGEPAPPPPDDGPADRRARELQYASRLLALGHGDFTVPHGDVPPSKAADQQNLADSIAYRDQLIKEGASQQAIWIVDGHIADLRRYLTLWETGGAPAVNDAAQGDDLGTQIGMTGQIFDTGLQVAGGEFGGHIGRFIKDTGMGGGGSQTVAPADKRIGGPGAPEGSSGPSEASLAPTEKLPATEPLPAAEPLPPTEKLPAGEVPAPGPGATEVGRPSPNQLAQARQGAAERAAGGGAEPAAEPTIQDQVARDEAIAREEATFKIRDGLQNDMLDSIYEHHEGESVEAAADRYAHRHSLGDTPYNPSMNDVNMGAAMRELEEVTTGRSKTLKPTDAVVETLYAKYEEAAENVREGERQFPDYWTRMSPEDAASLREKLDAGRGKDLDYWKGQLRENAPAVAPVAESESAPTGVGFRVPGGGVAVAGGVGAVVLAAVIVANLLGGGASVPVASPTGSTVAASPVGSTQPPPGGGAVGPSEGPGGGPSTPPTQVASSRNLYVFRMSASQSPVTDQCFGTLYYHYIYSFLVQTIDTSASSPDPKIVASLIGRTAHLTLVGPPDAGTYTSSVQPHAGLTQIRFDGAKCPKGNPSTFGSLTIDGLTLAPQPAGSAYVSVIPYPGP